MKRPRCCGRFAYWQAHLGPWRCTVCYKALGQLPLHPTAEQLLAVMPKSAMERFLDHAGDIAAKLPPWTDAERRFVTRNFGGVVTILNIEGES